MKCENLQLWEAWNVMLGLLSTETIWVIGCTAAAAYLHERVLTYPWRHTLQVKDVELVAQCRWVCLDARMGGKLYGCCRCHRRLWWRKMLKRIDDFAFAKQVSNLIENRCGCRTKQTLKMSQQMEEKMRVKRAKISPENLTTTNILPIRLCTHRLLLDPVQVSPTSRSEMDFESNWNPRIDSNGHYLKKVVKLIYFSNDFLS